MPSNGMQLVECRVRIYVEMPTTILRMKDTPRNVAVEAALRALQENNVNMTKIDQFAARLKGNRKPSPASGLDYITVEVETNERSANVSISLYGGGFFAKKRNQEFIERLSRSMTLSRDQVLDEIRSGTLTLKSATEMGEDQLPHGARKPAKEKKESKSSIGQRVLVAIVIIYFLNSEAGRNFLSSIIGDTFTETDISKYDCNSVARMLDGELVQNAIGGKFKIVDISNLHLISKTGRRISCSGLVTLGNGQETRMQLSVEKNDSGKMFLRAKAS